MILSLVADSNADIGPFALWEGTETLLLRRAKEEQEARRRRRRKEQRGDSIPWWKDIVAGLAGFGLLSSRTSIPTPTPSPAAAAAGSVVQEDPVLTAHDLFHSQSYDAALVDHFESLFFLAAPASSIIRRPRIERLVRQQGGSYASLRQRLEAMVLEAGGGGDDEDEGGGGDWGRGVRGRRGGAGVAAVAKWWKRLVRIEAQEEEARVMTPPTIPRRGGPRRHPFLNREIEAFERAARQVPGSSSRSTTLAPIVAAADENKDGGDDDNRQADEDHFECQCCFSSSEPSSPETRFSCEHVDDDHNKTKHSFCLACVRSLAQNYAFGETPLATGSLERLALPCMAATTSDEPCSGMIGREELCRALDEQLLGALERRMTETVLERFAAAATTARRRDGSNTTLVRCPFCLYAELVDPKPGPLVETFCPAWVREPFPPSASDILRSLLGTLILLPLLAIALALLVLVTPARRLERTYERTVAATASSSPPSPSISSSTSLTLLDRLILEPRLLPVIVSAHLAELCERVRARRRGQRTVFRCRNVEAAQGGRRARWEVVMRMDALDARALEWSKNVAEEEERDPYVEERRRERLVRFVWGEVEEEEGLREAADSSSLSSPQHQPARRTSSCGRVSCLLCQAALNPAAPSLHTCRAGTSSSSSAATPIDSNVSPQERAEERLRLAVEKAMNAAVVRECARCGAGLTKKGGEGACNKVGQSPSNVLFSLHSLHSLLVLSTVSDGFFELNATRSLAAAVSRTATSASVRSRPGTVTGTFVRTRVIRCIRTSVPNRVVPSAVSGSNPTWRSGGGKRRIEVGCSFLSISLPRSRSVLRPTITALQRGNSGRGRTPSGPRRWQNRNRFAKSAPTRTWSLVSCSFGFRNLAVRAKRWACILSLDARPSELRAAGFQLTR